MLRSVLLPGGREAKDFVRSGLVLIAVAVALDTAVADPDGGKMLSLTISGDGTAVDITDVVSGLDSSTINSGAALGFSPISHTTAETLAHNGTVELINSKQAGTVSEMGTFKIDAGAALQLDGSDAVNGLVITDGTNADAINLPGVHTAKTPWHASDDGHGGKTAHNAPAAETGEDTSVHSTSADNHFSVSSPFTEALSGNGDHSASLFKSTVEHHATVDPGINLDSIPKDHLAQHPADNVLHISAQPDHGADPTHPHVDGNRSASADDGGAHPGAVASDSPTLAALPSDSNGTHSPAALAHVVEPEELGRLGLYTILAEHGLTIARAHESISPTTLGPHDARDLGRPQCSPALLSHRISFTKTSIPVIDDHALLPADSVVITANRSAKRLEVHYTLVG